MPGLASLPPYARRGAVPLRGPDDLRAAALRLGCEHRREPTCAIAAARSADRRHRADADAVAARPHPAVVGGRLGRTAQERRSRRARAGDRGGAGRALCAASAHRLSAAGRGAVAGRAADAGRLLVLRLPGTIRRLGARRRRGARIGRGGDPHGDERPAGAGDQSLGGGRRLRLEADRGARRCLRSEIPALPETARGDDDEGLVGHHRSRPHQLSRPAQAIAGRRRCRNRRCPPAARTPDGLARRSGPDLPDSWQ